jgi:hypothetical protein
MSSIIDSASKFNSQRRNWGAIERRDALLELDYAAAMKNLELLEMLACRARGRPAARSSAHSENGADN